MPDRVFYSIDSDVEVKQYTYRTALVSHVFLSLSRTTPEMRGFEAKLAAAANKTPNNHTVYALTHEDNTVYVRFSNHEVHFGLSVTEYPNMY